MSDLIPTFEFIDDNGIVFMVEKQGSVNHYRYFLLRKINGYWIYQREVKQTIFNNNPSELEILFLKAQGQKG